MLAQLACEVRVLRPVSRNVFHPVPNVDSVLVGLRRTGPPPDPALRALVSAGFAHRRKALPGSLALAGMDRDRGAGGARGDRPPARRARGDARAGRVARAARGDAMRLSTRAPGKVNLCLFVGEPRADGLHPLVSVVQALSLADDADARAGGRATRTRSSAPASRARTSRAARSQLFREATGWDAPPQRLTIVKRIPVAAGMGGGSADAAAALRLAAHASGLPVPPDLPMRLGADVPSLLRPGRVLMTGAGEHVERLPDPEPLGVLVLPVDAELAHPRRLPRGRPARPHPPTRPARGARAPGARRARRRDRTTTSRTPPARCARGSTPRSPPPREAGAEHALVSGSGPTVVGLFTGPDGPARARAATGAWPRAVAAEPVDEDWARVVPA